MANNCERCGANLSLVGKRHNCRPRYEKYVEEALDTSYLDVGKKMTPPRGEGLVGEGSMTKPSQVEKPKSYKYRDQDKRREYMREYMRNYRSRSAS